MGDHFRLLNPYKILIQVKDDKEWKELSSEKIVAESAWMQPLEPMLVDDPDENVTLGQVSRKLAEIRKETKDLWNEKLLNDLGSMAKSSAWTSPVLGK